MKVILILTILTIKGSYINNCELPLESPDDTPNTIQWCIIDSIAYRITTYAMDHDIHVWKLGPDSSDFLKTALENNEKNYGDIIASQQILEIEDMFDSLAVDSAFNKTGLPGKVELVNKEYFYWTPDGVDYKSQSKPE